MVLYDYWQFWIAPNTDYIIDNYSFSLSFCVFDPFRHWIWYYYWIVLGCGFLETFHKTSLGSDLNLRIYKIRNIANNYLYVESIQRGVILFLFNGSNSAPNTFIKFRNVGKFRNEESILCWYAVTIRILRRRSRYTFPCIAIIKCTVPMLFQLVRKENS